MNKEKTKLDRAVAAAERGRWSIEPPPGRLCEVWRAEATAGACEGTHAASSKGLADLLLLILEVETKASGDPVLDRADRLASLERFCREIQAEIINGHPLDCVFTDPIQSLRLQRDRNNQAKRAATDRAAAAEARAEGLEVRIRRANLEVEALVKRLAVALVDVRRLNARVTELQAANTREVELRRDLERRNQVQREQLERFIPLTDPRPKRDPDPDLDSSCGFGIES